MKKRFTSVLCALVLLLTLTPVQQTKAADSLIPKDAKEYKGNYYYIYKDETTWEAAKENCEAVGGHLATITSASEQAFVKKLCENTKIFIWIGGTYTDKWEWVTGEKWNFTTWESNANYQSENSIFLDVYSLYNWTVRPNRWNQFYLCEWEAEDVDTRLPVKAIISSVKKASSTSVNITWREIEDAEGYSIYMKVGKDGKYKKIASTKEGDITTYKMSKLKAGTYYFRVRAYKTVYDEKSYGELSASKKITLK